MKNKIALLVIAAAAVVTSNAQASSYSDIAGIKDACVAGSLLDASGVPNKVVVCRASRDSEAGCIYSVDGTSYLYTPKGSAKVNPAQLDRVPLERVSRSEVAEISDGSRELKNGCLVFATCAFNQYHSDSHIKWAGIIAAQIVNIYGGGMSSGETIGGLGGHAITAFETDKREIFIQEDGEEPRKLDNMTELAQRGDRSWHDSSALIYCDRHIQGLSSFKSQFGRPE
jgi:hypothetical protein